MCRCHGAMFTSWHVTCLSPFFLCVKSNASLCISLKWRKMCPVSLRMSFYFQSLCSKYQYLRDNLKYGHFVVVFGWACNLTLACLRLITRPYWLKVSCNVCEDFCYILGIFLYISISFHSLRICPIFFIRSLCSILAKDFFFVTHLIVIVWGYCSGLDLITAVTAENVLSLQETNVFGWVTTKEMN